MTVALSKTTLYNRLGITAQQLAAFCDRHQVAELALFGSILRDDFHADSDIDILVTYQPYAQRGLLEKVAMKEELENLANRKVDLISKKAIENSRNWIRRRDILRSFEVVYVA
ncbi:MAG: DNA polymerase subunit beta [Phormidesmis priestleyi]|uniref:DNA polymerase subunit beta n=1 Tax=Phormidesmis priestleyi TaxID=268141 RepID=A0A2W4XRV5_9CYAN|nr:MAG: DNA polymerase subunit beta [Phormidesmis priestleyi]